MVLVVLASLGATLLPACLPATQRTLAMIGAFSPALARNGDGATVNIHSATAWTSIVSNTFLAAAKSAQWGLTNGVRLELDGQGTLVTALVAGMMATDTLKDAFGRLGITLPENATKDPAELACIALDGIEAGQTKILDNHAIAAKATASNASPADRMPGDIRSLTVPQRHGRQWNPTKGNTNDHAAVDLGGGLVRTTRANTRRNLTCPVAHGLYADTGPEVMPHSAEMLTALDLELVRRPLYGLLSVAAGPTPPQPRPVWFEAAVDGTMQLFTGPHTLKVRRLQKDPRASLTVTAPVGEREHWVSVTGRVTVDSEGALELAARLAARYWDLDDPDRAADLAAILAEDQVRVIIHSDTVKRYTM